MACGMGTAKDRSGCASTTQTCGCRQHNHLLEDGEGGGPTSVHVHGACRPGKCSSSLRGSCVFWLDVVPLNALWAGLWRMAPLVPDLTWHAF